VGWGLIEAVQDATNERIKAWYARKLLQRVEFFLLKWEEHPLRTQEEVLQLIRKAIVLGGGNPPPMPVPKRQPSRGGWVVSS
jgi:hypothetical protein